MKKTIYTLSSLLLVCVVGLILLFTGRVVDKREIKNLQIRADDLSVTLNGLENEKTAWQSEKARVSQGLVTVRAILGNTMAELDDVAEFIGFELTTNLPQPDDITETPLTSVTILPTFTGGPTKQTNFSPVIPTAKPSNQPTPAVSAVITQPVSTSPPSSLLKVNSTPSDTSKTEANSLSIKDE